MPKLQTARRLANARHSLINQASARANELAATGSPIIILTTGEPDFPTPSHILEAAIAAMRRGETKYTPVDGTLALKRAVQAKFERDNGLNYALEEIIVGTGAKQVIFNAILATVGHGDEVIIVKPCWTSYPDMVLLAEGTPVAVETRPENAFKITPDELAAAITPRTRWLIINAPCNPTGAIYTPNELRALGEVLQRYPDVWVLTDDIYEHIIYDGKRFANIAQVEPRLKNRTLTVNGVSKAYSMTGWRIGFGGGPKELIKAMGKIQSQSTTGASSIGQAAAVAALEGPQDVVAEHTRIFSERRSLVVSALNQMPGLKCHKPDGAFYAFVDLSGILGQRTPDGMAIETQDHFVQYLLDDHKVAVVGGEAFGAAPYMRISFATSLEKLQEAMSRIGHACSALR
jgi:aspartate aminotransferase